MNINTNSSYVSSASSNKGFSGLASGMDTESMVEAMLSGTQAKIDKQNAVKQQTLWKQEIYREIISSLNSFQSKYFSSTSSTSLMNSAFFSAMSAVASSSAFKVDATSSALAGNTSISVEQMATAAKLQSAKQNYKLDGKLDMEAIRDSVMDQDRSVTFNVNGKNVTVDFGDLYKNEGKVISGPEYTAADGTVYKGEDALVKKMQDTFDQNNLQLDVSIKGGELNITSRNAVTSDNPGDTIVVSNTSGSAGLRLLGLSSGASSQKVDDGSGGKTTSLTASKSMDTGAYYTVEVTINGIKNNIDVDMTTVKGSASQKYAEFERQFNEGMKAFGEIAKVKIDNKGNFEFEKYNDNASGIFDSSEIMISGNGKMLEATLGVKNGESNRIGLGGSLDMYFKDAFDANGEATLSINGKNITLTKDMTVGDMIRKVNASGAGVTMAYQSTSDTFTLTSSSTGAGFDINVSGTMADAIFGNTSTLTEGKNAIMTIDGQRIERTSNNVTYNGLNITLTGVSAKDAEGKAIEENITVSRNTDQIVEGVKEFIKDYNAILDRLNGLLDEDTEYRDYAPLTEAQKKEMTSKEIEAWEVKAKTGLLRNDNDLQTFLQSMRTALYQRPSGCSIALYDLGIETGKWEDKGKLVMTEDGEAQLRKMIESNAEEVIKLFTQKEDGLAAKMNSIVKATSGSTGTLVMTAGEKGKSSEAQSSMYQQLQQIENRIKTLKNQYEQQKTRYWNQFNAMEKMVAQLSSQSSWLAQSFGGY